MYSANRLIIEYKATHQFAKLKFYHQFYWFLLINLEKRRLLEYIECAANLIHIEINMVIHQYN